MNFSNDFNIRNRNTHTHAQDDRIIIEKHYIPVSLYRELYYNYNGQNNHVSNPYHTNPYPTNLYPTNPYSSQLPNLRNSFNPFNFNQSRYNQPFYSPFNNLFNTPLNNDNMSNVNNTSNISTTSNTVPSVTEIFNNVEHPQEILEPVEFPSVTLFSNFRHNIFNDLINRHIPFNIQVNDINAADTNIFNNAYQDESLVGIPLSNINIITNVLRFCDIVNDNNADTCSICQVPFNTTDICRIINNCNHIFHINCIDKWLFDHTTCPFCRYDLLNIDVSDNEQDLVTSTPNENGDDAYEGDDGYDGYEDGYDDADYDDDDDADYDDADYDDADYDDADENVTSDNANSENVTNENVTNENVTNENVTNENVTNENVTNENTNSNSTPQSIPQIFTRVFTTSMNSNTASIFNTEPMLNDINNFVNITTPFINSFMSGANSNASVRLNSSQINNQINRQINNFVNNLNPLLQSFGNFGNNRY
jgi:hypothetical protein